jgi:hypothetical protein
MALAQQSVRESLELARELRALERTHMDPLWADPSFHCSHGASLSPKEASARSLQDLDIMVVVSRSLAIDLTQQLLMPCSISSILLASFSNLVVHLIDYIEQVCLAL